MLVLSAVGVRNGMDMEPWNGGNERGKTESRKWVFWGQFTERASSSRRNKKNGAIQRHICLLDWPDANQTGNLGCSDARDPIDIYLKLIKMRLAIC